MGFSPPPIWPQSRLPAQRQDAEASHQSTQVTGRSSCIGAHACAGWLDCFDEQPTIIVSGSLFASRNSVYCPCVTSVESTQKLISPSVTRTASGPAVPGQVAPPSEPPPSETAPSK